jgi:hypothetical protein
VNPCPAITGSNKGTESSLADDDVPLLLSIVLQLPNASWISLLIGMEEDLVVVVVASGSYKQSITELLCQSKYKKTISHQS